MTYDWTTCDYHYLSVHDRVTGECLDHLHILYADDARGFYRAYRRTPEGRLRFDPGTARVPVEEIAADIEIRLKPLFAKDRRLRMWFAARKEESPSTPR